MIKACALAVFAAIIPGCAVSTTRWKGTVEWPDSHSGKNVVPFMEAGAALAAGAAIREMLKQNPFPDLFWGCSSPEQGLDVGVFTGPTPGLYYVLVDQRFDRCGGPRVRVLDGWYEYAVTPQGKVVAEAPPMEGESPPNPSPPPPEQTPASAAPPPAAETVAPEPTTPPTPPPTPATPLPAPGADTPEQTPPKSPAPPTPAVQPPSPPSPASPPPTTPG
jgi:hypothetical protein